MGCIFCEYKKKKLKKMLRLIAYGPAKTLCYRRLQILTNRYQLHLWLNDSVEAAEVKSVPHRDFYNVRKIDNHIHHSACMHQVWFDFLFIVSMFYCESAYAFFL